MPHAFITNASLTDTHAITSTPLAWNFSKSRTYPGRCACSGRTHCRSSEKTSHRTDTSCHVTSDCPRNPSITSSRSRSRSLAYLGAARGERAGDGKNDAGLVGKEISNVDRVCCRKQPIEPMPDTNTHTHTHTHHTTHTHKHHIHIHTWGVFLQLNARQSIASLNRRHGWEIGESIGKPTPQQRRCPTTGTHLDRRASPRRRNHRAAAHRCQRSCQPRTVDNTSHLSTQNQRRYNDPHSLPRSCDTHEQLANNTPDSRFRHFTG
jgi:hypothetical protein